MRLLFTPPKSKSLVLVAKSVIPLSPLVVAVHFFMRMVHGDYPSNADSIAIPIFNHWFLIFPFSFGFLIRGLELYTPDVHLFAWNPGHLWRSLISTILGCYVALNAVGMILDGIYGRLYWVSAFFILYLYLILIFRASVVMYDSVA